MADDGRASLVALVERCNVRVVPLGTVTNGGPGWPAGYRETTLLLKLVRRQYRATILFGPDVADPPAAADVLAVLLESPDEHTERRLRKFLAEHYPAAVSAAS